MISKQLTFFYVWFCDSIITMPILVECQKNKINLKVYFRSFRS